jgi:hypothetical protein
MPRQRREWVNLPRDNTRRISLCVALPKTQKAPCKASKQDPDYSREHQGIEECVKPSAQGLKLSKHGTLGYVKETESHNL